MNKLKNSFLLIPVFGTLIFVILYFIATLFYPGGSQVDVKSVGFSWENNYWCNLLSETAINGQPNSAKPIAFAGMFVVCITIFLFLIIFTTQTSNSKHLKLTIQVSGMFSMIALLFLPSRINHDLIINISSFFGILTTIGIFISLLKNKMYILFMLGMLIFLSIIINNLCYYNKKIIIYLPIVQKISFIYFLLWICHVNVVIYCKKKRTFNY